MKFQAVGNVGYTTADVVELAAEVIQIITMKVRSIVHKGALFLAIVWVQSTAGAQLIAETDSVPEPILSQCDPYLAELFRQPDESILVDELCQRIQSAHNTNSTARLHEIPPAQKLLWDVWSSKAMIDNGGMEYFLTADYVDFAGRAESFRNLGLIECADLLNQAYAEFPHAKVPDDLDERKRLFEPMPEEALDHWNKIDKQYYHCAGQLTLRLGEYARKNAEAFVALRQEVDDQKLAKLRNNTVRPPTENATGQEVVAWLEAIGGGSHDRSTEVLNSVWLGRQRRSTSEELQNLARWKRASEIEELGLDDTSFDDKDASLLLKFPKLRVLHLRNVSISERTIDVIEQMPSIQVLWITGTNIPIERVSKLAQLQDLIYEK